MCHPNDLNFKQSTTVHTVISMSKIVNLFFRVNRDHQLVEW